MSEVTCSPGRGVSTARRWRAAVLAPLAAVVAVVVPAGCSGVPQTVLSPPASYMFTRPLVGLGTYGAPGGQVVVCLDRRAPLRVGVSWSAGVNLDIGGERQSSLANVGQPWTSAPVGPGCGTLSAFTTPGFIPPSLTVTVDQLDGGG